MRIAEDAKSRWEEKVLEAESTDTNPIDFSRRTMTTLEMRLSSTTKTENCANFSCCGHESSGCIVFAADNELVPPRSIRCTSGAAGQSFIKVSETGRILIESALAFSICLDWCPAIPMLLLRAGDTGSESAGVFSAATLDPLGPGVDAVPASEAAEVSLLHVCNSCWLKRPGVASEIRGEVQSIDKRHPSTELTNAEWSE